MKKQKPYQFPYKGFTLYVYPGPYRCDTGKHDIAKIAITHPDLEYRTTKDETSHVQHLTLPHAKAWCDRMGKQLDKKGALSKADKQLAECDAMSIESDIQDALMKKNLA